MLHTSFTPTDRPPWLACVLAATLFWLTHLFNMWLFQLGELSEHINLVYLPSFLRLANVLILGLWWGAFATAVGGLFLILWSPDGWLMSLLNIAVSASAASLAVLCLQTLRGTRLSPTRLLDLLWAALLCGVISASLHHFVWSYLDPSQLIAPYQLAYMIAGDINGAMLGALLLRWIAKHTRIAALLQERARN